MSFNSPVNKRSSLLSSFVLLASLVCFAMAQQPAPEPTLSPSANDAYRIRSGDKLSIKLLYHSELSEPSVVVRPDGFITLAMIDEVMARGLTVAEMKTSIEKAYSEVLLNPVVSINLIEYVAPRIYVGGQVAKPGRYDLREGHTLMQAIILAGGFTREANRKMVMLARPDTEGKLKMTAFDTMQMLSDSRTVREVTLEGGDYIFVPDSKLSKMSRVIEVFRELIPTFGLGVRY